MKKYTVTLTTFSTLRVPDTQFKTRLITEFHSIFFFFSHNLVIADIQHAKLNKKNFYRENCLEIDSGLTSKVMCRLKSRTILHNTRTARHSARAARHNMRAARHKRRVLPFLM